MMLDVNGVEYTNFTAATCEIRLDSLSNSFNFDLVAPDGKALPFKGGEACKVIVDGETVLTGYIEVINLDYDGADHTISIRGRDKTSDLLDSTIDNIDDIIGDGLTLKKLIEKVIDQIGLDIKVIDEVNPKPYSFAEDVAAPEPGDNAFSFIERYSKKRQVLLTSNGDGNLVITKNTGKTAQGAVQHIIGAQDNNVISSSYVYDTTRRYKNYKISSALNPVALNQAGDTDPSSLVNQSGGVIDNDIRRGRQLVIISDASFSDGPCLDLAKWEADIRRARGQAYSATVPGYRVGVNSGDLWRINRIYQIVDDFVGKIEPMLCNSITFTFDLDNGRNTSLGFVGQKAYTLFIEPDPFADIAINVE